VIRFTFRRDTGRIVARFAFSLRKCVGRFYDIRTDEMLYGRYVVGRVLEFSWINGRKPALSFTKWSAPL
jgi:hypothetical protein